MNACSEAFAVGHGDVRLPDWLMEMDISKGAKLTYNVLATCSRGDDFTWPSQKYLAGRLSSSIRTVQRHLLELITHGLIKKGREYVKGKVRRVYHFLSEHDGAVKVSSQQHDKMSRCPSEFQKNFSTDTTKCRAKGDILSCSLNKEETIKGNNPPPTPQGTPAVYQGDADSAEKVGDLFLESKKEDPEWSEAKKILECDLSLNTFQTWIAPLLFERNGSEVVLRCPNDFFLNWVKSHFNPQIKIALDSVGLTEWQFSLFTPEQQKADDERKAKVEKLQKEALKATARAAAPPEDVDSLPLDEQFEWLYRAYPEYRREARKLAKDTFLGIFQAECHPKFSVLLNAVNRSKREKESWQRNNGRYVPQLHRWLSEERWLD